MNKHIMKKGSPSPKEPEMILPETGPDLTDEVAAEEEDDELEISDLEKEDPLRQPEITDPELETLTKWDEPIGQYGRRIEPTGLEDENSAAVELFEGGLDVAEDELRDERETDESLEEAEEEEAEERADEE
jgi:hypothetical protein